jgi:hypothetical protein
VLEMDDDLSTEGAFQQPSARFEGVDPGEDYRTLEDRVRGGEWKLGR